MKKIILTLTVLGICLTSCEDFLTQHPGDKVVPEDFFRSERELELYANSFYEKDLPGVNEMALGDKISDITAITSPEKYMFEGYTDADQGGWTWGKLRNINFFIDHVKVSPVAEEVKNRYLGIARFWRAKFYFEKVKTFGDVPWYDYCLSDDDEALYKQRDSRELVMQKVLEDLNYAVDWCSAEKDASCSLVTRYVALALKARVCLHEGTFRKYHPEMGLTGAADWLRQAADAAWELMQSGKYELVNTGEPTKDYRSLFIAEGIKGISAINKEVIFAHLYDAEFRHWHDVTWKYNSGTAGSRWSLTRQFVNTYLMQDGSRFTDQNGYQEKVFPEEVKNRDYRLSSTIRTPGYTRANGKAALPDFAITLTGYHLMKWSLDDPFYDSSNQATNAMPVFRYAEILLIYAEAKAELGEFNSSVWQKTIRLLRERAGVDPREPAVADLYLQETFYPEITDKYLLEIRRERAIELIAENFRYDDLMRWKKGDLLASENTPWMGIYIPQLNAGYDLDGDGKADVCFYTGSKPAVSAAKFYKLDDNFTVTDLANRKGNLVWASKVQRHWEAKKYLRPIPRNVRVVNPDLSQNPGWGN